MKKGQQWFERILQVGILLTGFYIIYRGTGILKENGWMQRILKPEKAVEVMEEGTAEMFLPIYRSVFEQLPEETLLYQWLDAFLPAFRQGIMQIREQVQEAENNTEAVTSRETSAQPERKEGTEAEAAESESIVSTEKEEIAESESSVQTDSEEGTETETAAQTDSEEETETGTAAQMEREEPDIAWQEEESEETAEETWTAAKNGYSFEYLLNHYYVVDSDTTIDDSLLDAKKLLSKNFYLEKKSAVPQSLIYHTHSQEYFVDSREEDINTGIMGIGDELEKILEKQYGYQVIHDRGIYDLVDGVLDRSSAYDYARKAVEKILEENPTIEIIIDLHRDGVEGEHFITEINGKSTARIMFFNGLSQNSSGQNIDYLYNPYIEDNLGFSLQLQMTAEQLYPGFTRNIYLKGQRFNLHLRPRSLLVEAGTQLNTIEEEKNAMKPLADILNRVLQKN